MLHSFHLFADSIQWSKHTGKKKWQIKAEVRICDNYMWLYAEGSTKDKAYQNLIFNISNQVACAYQDLDKTKNVEEVA